jgi:AAA domain
MSFDFPRTAFVEAILRELESTPLILVCGPRGGGKSWLLRRFARECRSREPGAPIALVQIEPVSSSPEVLHRELARIAGPALGKPRGAATTYSFDGLLDALQRRPKDSLLLLDDVTEIRTLSYYPSVEAPLDTFLDALKKGGRALLTSRFSYWMERRFPELPLRRLPPLSSDELEEAGAPEPDAVARATAGLAVHAARLAETLEETTFSSSRIENALAAELSAGGRIEAECRATLAELLHRARGYGACKSVLHVLAEEEGLKLTEVARRLDRTPGSTRDYLRWLEEVDLVVAREKRFFYVDPLLRLWMRIHGRGEPPSEDDLRREVQHYLGRVVPASRPTPRDEDTDADADADADTESGFTLPPPPSEDLVEID